MRGGRIWKMWGWGKGGYIRRVSGKGESEGSKLGGEEKRKQSTLGKGKCFSVMSGWIRIWPVIPSSVS